MFKSCPSKRTWRSLVCERQKSVKGFGAARVTEKVVNVANMICLTADPSRCSGLAAARCISSGTLTIRWDCKCSFWARSLMLNLGQGKHYYYNVPARERSLDRMVERKTRKGEGRNTNSLVFQQAQGLEIFPDTPYLNSK